MTEIKSNQEQECHMTSAEPIPSLEYSAKVKS
jgi:hypothetical protein